MAEALIIFDVGTVVVILVLSNLSRRLGEALKINRYYKLLHLTAIIVATAFVIELITVCTKIPVNVPFGFSNSLRLTGSAGAFIITLIYWKWLFSEFISR